eukprot:TRINITY_DN779790_c0_g1_i1.p1 TRINITY_DN779790_c0_g1~~TRINITY_DN779790_c0_g1_i1.p1  ORF type:complete len:235 (+),score=95.59 TRINITY_DN779790_c0_g1_i1:103-807(+)
MFTFWTDSPLSTPVVSEDEEEIVEEKSGIVEKEPKKRRRRRKHKSRRRENAESDKENTEEPKRKRRRRRRRAKSPEPGTPPGTPPGSPPKAAAIIEEDEESSSDEDAVGPRVPEEMSKSAFSAGVDYGNNMLKGEAAAIAQFVQRGMRVPRRGEVGWTGEEIDSLEKLGYCMSGNRNKMMNAVRERKEAQVETAEEKKQLILSMIEAEEKKENDTIDQFRAIIQEKIRKQNLAK